MLSVRQRLVLLLILFARVIRTETRVVCITRYTCALVEGNGGMCASFAVKYILTLTRGKCLNDPRFVANMYRFERTNRSV